MTDIGQYNFVVTSLLTGNVIDTVELSSFYWDEIKNAPGSGLATARLDVRSTDLETFKDWHHALWAIKNGTIQFGGIIGKTQIRGGTRVLNIPVHGFLDYYESRTLQGFAGMSNATIENNTDITWNQVDMFEIANDFFAHAHSFDDGDIGIDLEWDNLSGILISMKYSTVSRKRIATAFRELANRVLGFTFYQVYSFDGNGNPTCNIKLEYPAENNVSSEVLLYQPERTVTETINAIRSMNLDGSANTRANAGNVLSITGDMEVFAGLDLTDWTPGVAAAIVADTLAVGNQRGWWFYLNSSGSLVFEWSEDGVSFETAIVSAAVSFTDGYHGVGVSFDASIRQATFYVNEDMASPTWTVLSTSSTAAATSIFNGTSSLEIGSRNGGGNYLTGEVLFAVVNEGFGSPVARFDARLLEPGDTTYEDPHGNTFTLTGNAAIQNHTSYTKESKIPTAKRSNILDYDDNGVERPVTGISVIGSGEGASQRSVYLQATNGSTPLWEEKVSYSDQDDTDILTSYAQQILRDGARLTSRRLKLTLDRELEPFHNQILPGQAFRTVIDDQVRKIDDLFIVGKKRTTLAENQDNVVTLDVLERANRRVIYGYGSSVTGGEGQTEYIVTNLNNSGSGSLRDALSAGNRNIVADPSLSGTLTLDNDIQVDTLDNITVNLRGRININAGRLDFANCTNIRIQDCQFSGTSGITFTSKSGLSEFKDLTLQLIGNSFIGPLTAYAVRLEDSYTNYIYVTHAYNFYSTLANVMLVDNQGANEGGYYYVTGHNNFYFDITDNAPKVDNCNYHEFNSAYIRYGNDSGGGGAAQTRGDGAMLIERCVATARSLNDIVGASGATVTTVQTEFAGPEPSETSSVNVELNNTKKNGATATDSNTGSIFTVPYDYYPALVPNESLIEYDAGHILDGPRNTEYIIWVKPPTRPSTSLEISAGTSGSRRGGLIVLNNPIKDTGGTIIFGCIAPGPSESASGSYTVPDADAVQIFDFAGDLFVPRIRAWSLTENGKETYTAGWSDTADIHTFFAIGLDGLASDINVTATPTYSTASSQAFPTLTGTQVNDRIINMNVQQSKDELISHSTYTISLNDTIFSPLAIAISSYEATGTSETPNNATWDGTESAKVNWVVGVRA